VAYSDNQDQFRRINAISRESISKDRSSFNAVHSVKTREAIRRSMTYRGSSPAPRVPSEKRTTIDPRHERDRGPHDALASRPEVPALPSLSAE